MIGLYIHVPFCKKKCDYCDFYSLKYEDEKAYVYADAVRRNLRFYNERYDTVYFGGGTPSLAVREICGIMTDIRFSDGAEITIEANPDSITSQGLSSLHDCGVNRVSIGVQSFSNSELSKLGRRHNAETARFAVNIAAESGFKNISVDLMLGIPTQTPLSVKRNIKTISTLPINHVSAYMLKVEPNTAFAFTNPALPTSDETAELYKAAVDALESVGFHQYEISNFAKPGYECKHNLKYWESKEYLGIGPAAHSYYDGERFAVPPDFKAFVKSPAQPVYITDPNPHSFGEYAMLKLRLAEGLTFAEIASFGADKNLLLKNAGFVPENYISISEKGIRITKDGFLLSNQIIGRLLDGVKL